MCILPSASIASGLRCIQFAYNQTRQALWLAGHAIGKATNMARPLKLSKGYAVPLVMESVVLELRQLCDVVLGAGQALQRSLGPQTEATLEGQEGREVEGAWRKVERVQGQPARHHGSSMETKEEGTPSSWPWQAANELFSPKEVGATAVVAKTKGAVAKDGNEAAETSLVRRRHSIASISDMETLQRVEEQVEVEINRQLECGGWQVWDSQLAAIMQGE